MELSIKKKINKFIVVELMLILNHGKNEFVHNHYDTNYYQ